MLFLYVFLIMNMKILIYIILSVSLIASTLCPVKAQTPRPESRGGNMVVAAVTKYNEKDYAGAEA